MTNSQVEDSEGTGHSVVRTARRLAGRFGAARVAHVLAETLATEAEARDTILTTLHGAFLIGDWFWLPQGKTIRNRLDNTSRMILSVTGPVDFDLFLDGVKRRYAWRVKEDRLPPQHVLQAYFQANPLYIVSNDTIAYREQLDYRMVLGKGEQIFVEVLRKAGGALDRHSFQERCLKRGMNINTFNVEVTFSPILVHAGVQVWALRAADWAAIERVVQRKMVKRRQAPVEMAERGESVAFVYSITKPLTSLVIHLPKAQQLELAGRSFAVAERKFNGWLKVNAQGSSWGYSQFLRRLGAKQGDVMTVAFDRKQGTASVQVA